MSNIAPPGYSIVQVGDTVRAGDVFRADGERLLPLSKSGKLFGVSCYGSEVKKSGDWLRPVAKQPLLPLPPPPGVSPNIIAAKVRVENLWAKIDKILADDNAILENEDSCCSIYIRVDYIDEYGKIRQFTG
jgi:hypothetical protein